MILSCLAAFALVSGSLAAELKAADTVVAPPYPEGFLQWRLLRADKLDPKNPATAQRSDVHFVYGNEKAVAGLRTGSYAEGAVFVLDIFDVNKKDGVVTLGERASTSNMVRDSRAVATGGWAFGDFDLVSRKNLPMDAIAACFNCHTQKADHGYVFTQLKF